MMVSGDHPYHALLMRDLKAQVEALKVEGTGENPPGQGGGQLPVYEVYTRTEAGKFAHLSKVSMSCDANGRVCHVMALGLVMMCWVGVSCDDHMMLMMTLVRGLVCLLCHVTYISCDCSLVNWRGG